MLLIEFISLDRKILPALMHFARNWSLPMSDSTSLLVAVVLYNQHWISFLMSSIFVADISMVIVFESNVTPRH